MISLIQHFEADFPSQPQILNSGIILKAFTHVSVANFNWLFKAYVNLTKASNFLQKHSKRQYLGQIGSHEVYKVPTCI